MPTKKYVLKLSVEERKELSDLVRVGRAPGWKLVRAQALLKCDQGPAGPGWSDARIAEAFDCTSRSLEAWRKQAVEQGPLSLLERKSSNQPRATKLDGEGEARLTALACSQAPPGYSRWSLRLLAEHLVILEVTDRISHETVRQVLKKTI
jgi:Homeodomain-like domain